MYEMSALQLEYKFAFSCAGELAYGANVVLGVENVNHLFHSQPGSIILWLWES